MPTVRYLSSLRDHANNNTMSETALSILLTISTVEPENRPPGEICEYFKPSVSQSKVQMAVVQTMNAGG